MNSVQNVFSQTKAGSVLNISKKMKQYQHKMSFHTQKKCYANLLGRKRTLPNIRTYRLLGLITRLSHSLGLYRWPRHRTRADLPCHRQFQNSREFHGKANEPFPPRGDYLKYQIYHHLSDNCSDFLTLSTGLTVLCSHTCGSHVISDEEQQFFTQYLSVVFALITNFTSTGWAVHSMETK